MRTGWIGMGVAAAAMMLSGCADHVTKREAKDSWRATQKAMTSIGLGTGFELTASGSAGPDGASGVVKGSVDCEQSGAIEAIAQGEVTAETIDSSFEVEFDECSSDDITLDGVLTYEMHIDENAFTADFYGALDVTGDAKGYCEIDGHVEVGLSEFRFIAVGDICGFEWHKLRG